MKATNTKILVAPILAITFALLLAGAITSLPFLPQNATPYSPQPTAGSAYATQQPQAMASAAPSPLPLVYIAGAFLVVIVAALLFFREKSLTKALQE